MPKVKIDYSNTIFYKIYCKDPNIAELYIGHTTNFVQRKHAHKQTCSNIKSSSYNCKLYEVIRNNDGWDNWKMDIIAFHECHDLFSAKKYEQQYFEEFKATLNSIEPLPKPKPKVIKEVIKKEKPILYCEVCNVYFNTIKLQESHNKTKKHIKKKESECEPNMATKYTSKNISTFHCKLCGFICSKKGDYNRHLLTRKHELATNDNNDVLQKTSYICDNCNKEYLDRTGLWRHKKKCSIDQVENNNKPTEPEIDTGLIEMLLKNQSVMEKLIEKMEHNGLITKDEYPQLK